MNAPAQPRRDDPRIPAALRAILILLVVSVAINYIDRTSLSTAAPLLQRPTDLAIPPAKMGVLLSAFFWAFAVCSVVVLIGAAAYAFLVGPVEQLQWPADGKSKTVN